MLDEPSSQEPYWPFVILAAQHFEAKGSWPHLDDLIYEMAAGDHSVGLSVPYQIPRHYGYVNNDGELELSALGLVQSKSAPRSTELILRLVHICVQLALEFRRSAKVSSEVVADQFVEDEFAKSRALELISKVPGLVGGGRGGVQDDEWDRDITVSALAYKEIRSEDDLIEYLTNRANLNGPTLNASFGTRTHDVGSIEKAELATHVNFNSRNVFVVYGRDSEATEALWTFLEALELHPMSWDELVRSTGMATPYTGDVVAKAFEQVQAVVVLLTPDDEARLHESLHKEDDPPHETTLTGQPRPNVFFEAGMAFGRHPDRTIIVEVGTLRPASDLLGRNTVRLGQTEGPLEALANRLESAGCPVNRAHPAWLNTERFVNLDALIRKSSQPLVEDSSLPRGTRLSEESPSSETRITARLIGVSKNEHLLEIVNRGDTDVVGLQWYLPSEAKNWAIMVQVLPQYPISELRRGEHIRLPVAIMSPGPVMTDLRITAVTDEGHHFETTARLSIYG